MQGLEEAEENEWARARMIAYYITLPNVKMGKKLKMTDLMELPTFDKKRRKTSDSIAKAYRLTPDEIKSWHAGTWVPPDKLIKEG